MPSRCVPLCRLPASGGTELVSALVALRFAAKGPVAYGPLVMVIVSLSGYWTISRVPWSPCFSLPLVGSEDFASHPFVSPIVSLLV